MKIAWVQLLLCKSDGRTHEYLCKVLVVFAIFTHVQVINGQTSKTVTIKAPLEGQSRYLYIPFEVPAGAKSISIKFSYDAGNGANRLDFGVFDPSFSGRENDKRGFRGWSGSVRDEIFIADDMASNGFVDGKITPGTWHVIAGLIRSQTTGFDLKLEFDFNRIAAKPLADLERENTKNIPTESRRNLAPVIANGLKWHRGDLHSHSFHSDGRWTIRAMLESARSQSLDFLAITEHNTFSHHRDIDTLAKEFPGMTVIKGEEVTTYGGHINIWGLGGRRWVDFRAVPGRETSGRQIAAEAHALGALASINHPTMDCGGCNWTYGESWNDYDSVEVWNATWSVEDERTLKLWDERLRGGKIMTGLGSSDSHQPPSEPSIYPTNLRMGEPTVFAGSRSRSQTEILKAIRLGRVFVTEDPGMTVEFATQSGETIGDQIIVKRGEETSFKALFKGFPANARVVIVSNTGVVKESTITSPEFPFTFSLSNIGNSYVRVEVRNTDGRMLAFTNPIYLRIK